MLEFVQKEESILIKSTETDKVYFTCNIDKSHYAKRYIDVIVSELNGLAEYMTNERINYELLETLNQCQKKKSIIEICDFIAQKIDVFIEAFIRDKGYKEEDTGRTFLFVEQYEIDNILKYSVRAKIALLIFAQYPELENKALKLVSDCIDKNTANKLFRLILHKLSPIKIDRMSWEFLKHTLFDSIDTYTLYFYSFIQRQVLITLQIDKNPIVYILSVAGDCMKWMSHVSTHPYTDFDSKSYIFITNKSTAKIYIAEDFRFGHIVDKVKLKCKNINYRTVPTVDVWCEIAKKLLNIKKLSLTDAIMVSMYASYKLDRQDCEVSRRCPTLLQFSKYIPIQPLKGTRVPDRYILSEPLLTVNNTSLKTFTYLQLKRYHSYKYINPWSKQENIIILRLERLLKDLIELFKFLVHEDGYNYLYNNVYKNITIVT